MEAEAIDAAAPAAAPLPVPAAAPAPAPAPAPAAPPAPARYDSGADGGRRAGDGARPRRGRGRSRRRPTGGVAARAPVRVAARRGRPRAHGGAGGGAAAAAGGGAGGVGGRRPAVGGQVRAARVPRAGPLQPPGAAVDRREPARPGVRGRRRRRRRAPQPGRFTSPAKPWAGGRAEAAAEATRPEKQILLISGPPGLGKTTLAHVAARHAGYRPLEINASDERSAKVMRARVKEATDVQAVFGDRRPPLVVLDEIDGAMGGAEGSGAINELIRIASAGGARGGGGDGGDDDDGAGGGGGAAAARAAGLQRPVICICNDLHAPALRPLRAAAELVDFRAASNLQLAQRLKVVCEREGLDAEPTRCRRSPPSPSTTCAPASTRCSSSTPSSSAAAGGGADGRAAALGARRPQGRRQVALPNLGLGLRRPHHRPPARSRPPPTRRRPARRRRRGRRRRCGARSTRRTCRAWSTASRRTTSR